MSGQFSADPVRRVMVIVALWFSSILIAIPAASAAKPDPDAAPLSQRLQAIDADPQRNGFAAHERLQAHRAVEALRSARRKQRLSALQLARLRVETAEIAVRTEASRSQLQRLDLERSELLVEASRRDAERARAEAERMRIAAQIQAEETARLRAAIDNEARARQQAEGALDAVAGVETEKLRAAEQLDAELARKEAELMAAGAANQPKTKPKTKPKRKAATTAKPRTTTVPPKP